MVVDRRFAQRVLADIERHVLLLRDAAALPRQELFADPLRALGVQHALQIAIEGVVSLSHHLIAYGNFATPERDADTPQILLHHGVLSDAGLAARIPAMIRFRNLLVHRYWQVEQAKLSTVLDTNLDDLVHFAEQVQQFLDDNPTV